MITKPRTRYRPDGTIWCPACKSWKAKSEFSTRTVGGRPYPMAKCRECLRTERILKKITRTAAVSDDS